MDGFPPISPNIGSRFFDIDDRFSDFSSDAPSAAQEPPRKPRPSTHFNEDCDDEFMGEESEYKDNQNADDKWCKTVDYVPVQSKRVNYLTCEDLHNQPEDETKAARDKVEAEVKDAQDKNIAPNFLQYCDEPDPSQCLLCQIYLSEMTSSASGEKTVHPLLNAYQQLKDYDLRYCGFQAEPTIMKHCTAIFNQLSGEYAAKSKTPPRLLTEKDTCSHLYDHDVSNPKRPIVIATAQVRYLTANLFNGCVGKTTSGKKVIRQANISAYNTLVRLRTDLNARFTEASSHVNTISQGSDQKRDISLRPGAAGQILGRKRPKSMK